MHHGRKIYESKHIIIIEAQVKTVFSHVSVQDRVYAKHRDRIAEGIYGKPARIKFVCNTPRKNSLRQ